MNKVTELSVPRLDLFLASTMRAGAGLSERLAAFRVTPASLTRERIDAERAGFGDPRRTTVGLVMTHFGVPTTASPDRLVYDLVLWPDHYFEWQLSDRGGATFDGFRLKKEPPQLAWAPLELEPLRILFSNDYHTAVEVQRVLGEPQLNLSWGFLGEWYYGPSDAGDDICFSFDYALLRDITTHHGVIASHRDSG